MSVFMVTLCFHVWCATPSLFPFGRNLPILTPPPSALLTLPFAFYPSTKTLSYPDDGGFRGGYHVLIDAGGFNIGVGRESRSS